MRLKPEKIEDLARKILQAMKENPEIAFRSDDDTIIHEIRETILLDLKREDELEDEVRDILQQHMKRIYRDDINYADLVRKAKRQLARERGLIL